MIKIKLGKKELNTLIRGEVVKGSSYYGVNYEIILEDRRAILHRIDWRRMILEAMSDKQKAEDRAQNCPDTEDRTRSDRAITDKKDS